MPTNPWAQLAARGTSRALADEQLFSPEEEQSLLGSLLDTGTSGLSFVGNVLDTPGRFVRTTIAGKNPFASIFDPSRGVTGEQLLGLDKGNPAGFDAGDIPRFIGGLGAEIALDPLTYIGLPGAASAATQAGKMAGKAGLMARLAKVPGRAAMGKATRGVKTTLGNLLEPLVEESGKATVKHGGKTFVNDLFEDIDRRAMESGRNVNDLLEQPLSHGWSWGVPFTDIGGAMPGGAGAAAGVDWLGRKISNAALRDIPFFGPKLSKKLPKIAGFAPIRAARSLFTAPFRETTTEGGNIVGEAVHGVAQTAREAERELANRLPLEMSGRDAASLLEGKRLPANEFEQKALDELRRRNAEVLAESGEVGTGVHKFISPHGDEYPYHRQINPLLRQTEEEAGKLIPKDKTGKTASTYTAAKHARDDLSRGIYSDDLDDAFKAVDAMDAEYAAKMEDSLMDQAMYGTSGEISDPLQDMLADIINKRPIPNIATGEILQPDQWQRINSKAGVLEVLPGRLKKLAAFLRKKNKLANRRAREHGLERADIDLFMHPAVSGAKGYGGTLAANATATELARHMAAALDDPKMAALLKSDNLSGERVSLRTVLKNLGLEEGGVRDTVIAKLAKITGQSEDSLRVTTKPTRHDTRAIKRLLAAQALDYLGQNAKDPEAINKIRQQLGALSDEANAASAASAKARFKARQPELQAKKAEKKAAERATQDAENQRLLATLPEGSPERTALLAKMAASEKGRLAAQAKHAQAKGRLPPQPLPAAAPTAKVTSKTVAPEIERMSIGGKDVVATAAKIAPEQLAEILHSTLGESAGTLNDAYKTLKPKLPKDYTKADFIRDIFEMQTTGKTTTQSGHVISFPAATGTRGEAARGPKESLLIVPKGQMPRWLYGIRIEKGAAAAAKVAPPPAAKVAPPPAAAQVPPTAPQKRFANQTDEKILNRAMKVKALADRLNITPTEAVRLMREKGYRKRLPQGTWDNIPLITGKSGEATRAALINEGKGKGFLEALANHLGGPPEGMARAEFIDRLRSRKLPYEFARDLVRSRVRDREPQAAKGLLSFVDGLSNFWKATVLARPARHVRDLISSQVKALQEGHILPQEMGSIPGQVYRVLKGKEIEGLSNDPAFRRLLAKEGVTNPTDKQATDFLRELVSKTETAGRFGGEYGGQIDSLDAGSPRQYLESRPGQHPLGLADIAKDLFFAGGKKSRGMNIRGVGAHETTFGPLRASEKAQQFTDSFTRIGSLLSLVKRGYDPSTAADMIRKAQVDYRSISLTKTEQQWATRLFPFYRFSKGSASSVLRSLYNQPGGPLAQTIRGTNRLRGEDDQFLPEYISQGLAIPLPSGESGDPRFLSGFGLMHEAPLSYFGGGLRGAILEGASQLTPGIKFPLEWGTGRTFFQRGPEGGRDIGDLDPILGRIAQNVGLTAKTTGQAEPILDSHMLESLFSNSPLSSAGIMARVATDQRKSPTVKAANLLTGVKITDVSEGARQSVIREAAQRAMKKFPGAVQFTRTTVPKEIKEKMLREGKVGELQQLEYIEDVMEWLTMQSKKRAAERKKS